MAATREEICGWLEEAKQLGATHLIVVCDTFGHEDYPVFVMPGQNPQEKADLYREDMEKVMEVYSLSHDIGKQLAEHRAIHFD